MLWKGWTYLTLSKVIEVLIWICCLQIISLSYSHSSFITLCYWYELELFRRRFFVLINKLGSEQNGHHLADDIFKSNFLNGNDCIQHFQIWFLERKWLFNIFKSNFLNGNDCIQHFQIWFLERKWLFNIFKSNFLNGNDVFNIFKSNF